MKVVGEKEVKKAAKLTIKKRKIDNKIAKLSKQYISLISPKVDDEYFRLMVEDYIKHNM